MSALCSNPNRERHEIADDSRRIDIVVSLDWGSDDLRAESTGSYSFCSFACLGGWADLRSTEHDGHVLRDGDT